MQKLGLYVDHDLLAVVNGQSEHLVGRILVAHFNELFSCEEWIK